MESVVKPLQTTNTKPMMIGAAIIIIVVGIGVGYMVSNKKSVSTTSTASTSVVKVNKDEAGVTDLTNYKDTATGTLQVGGIKGEGTYHLDRPGGATQTVYLNSAILNMGPFVGKKVQVWGQSQASDRAPWLMDVGKIQVVQ
ncbi:hypothetical protein BH10PAT1_BH10PAT1_3920 [soil metagenome]